MSDWFIWPLGISIWLAIGWAGFAWRETLGIEHKGSAAGHITLSYWTYRVTQAWPPAIFLIGLFVGMFWGGLMVHFWWHWCPAGSISVG